MITADEIPGRLVAGRLAGCVGAVELMSPAGAARPSWIGTATGGTPDLVVIVDGGPPAAVRELEARCSHARVPWLRTASDAGAVHVGPLVGPGDCACHQGFEAGRAAGAPQAGVPPPGLHDAWAALVAITVIHVVGGIGARVGPDRIATYDLDGWESRDLAIPHLPDCRSGLHPSRGPIPDRPPAERR
jgi:hypothetical protein